MVDKRKTRQSEVRFLPIRQLEADASLGIQEGYI